MPPLPWIDSVQWLFQHSFGLTDQKPLPHGFRYWGRLSWLHFSTRGIWHCLSHVGQNEATLSQAAALQVTGVTKPKALGAADAQGRAERAGQAQQRVPRALFRPRLGKKNILIISTSKNSFSRRNSSPQCSQGGAHGSPHLQGSKAPQPSAHLHFPPGSTG